MHVLISIQQRVPQWQIPEAAARSLIARFPDVQFTYATTEADNNRIEMRDMADPPSCMARPAAPAANQPMPELGRNEEGRKERKVRFAGRA